MSFLSPFDVRAQIIEQHFAHGPTIVANALIERKAECFDKFF